MFFFHLFYIFCLYHLTLVEADDQLSCGTRQCIVCLDEQDVFKDTYIDCLVVNLTSNLSVITCNFTLNDSVCENGKVLMRDIVCHFSLKYVQSIGRWIYRPLFEYLFFPNDRDCDRVCDTHYQLASYEDIFKREYECYCYEKNCNLLGNITISLVSTTVSSSSLDLMSMNKLLTSTLLSPQPYYPTITSQLSTLDFTTTPTHTSSSVTTAMDKYTDSSSIMTLYELDSSTASSTTSTTTSLRESLTTVDTHRVFIGVIAGLVFALTVILTTFLLTVCTLLYRKHASKRSHHSLHHVHVHSPFPIYDPDLSDNPITVLNNIGYGKFGSVYKALYNGSPVAVKLFDHHHHSSWENERKLYTLDSTTHPHILHYIGSEERSVGPRKQLYMITEYHALGSLNHYLQHNTLTWPQTHKMISSVSSGLAHLHSNVFVNSDGSIVDKFAIAHRDVKSANVLVKDNSGHCVLGDLGLALILDPEADDRKIANSGQVGTYRYMAPEALDARVNLRDLESFKQIDVYALALVVWEVCYRCEVGDGPVLPYQSPYFSIVGERPTLEMMKDIVVLERSRPDIVGCWYSHPGLKQMINIMEESWDEDPEARLTAANIVSRLETLERALRTEETVEEYRGSCKALATPSSSSHKKLQMSSSFSGNSNCHPPIFHTRLSVDNTVSNRNMMPSFQRCPRRSSLTNHIEQVENKNLPTRKSVNCTPTPLSVSSTAVYPQSEIQTPHIQDEEHQSSSIDAATGQPKRNDDLSSLNSSSSSSIHNLDNHN